MFQTFQIPITWTELIKRTARETMDDDVLGLSAQLAYYFFLALFPALLFIIALTSFFPPNFLQNMLQAVEPYAPQEILAILREQITNIANGENGGLLTFGVLAAIWSSSAALVAIVSAMNRAYDIEEGRPWWKVRLVAIGLTLGLAIFMLLSFGLVLLGPTMAEWLAGRYGFGTAFELGWKILQWPIVFALVAVALAMLNYLAPDAEQDWEWVTPGAVVATVLWLLGTLAFKFYVSNFGSYNETYGTIGGVMVLMLWFYISGLAILIGTEMNAEIEHASPYGKEPGEKVPGQKKKLGAAAAREFAERQKRQPSQPGEPEAAPARLRRAPAAARLSAAELQGQQRWPGLLFYVATRLARLGRARS